MTTKKSCADKTLVLILGDRLSLTLSSLKSADPKHTTVLMAMSAAGPERYLWGGCCRALGIATRAVRAARSRAARRMVVYAAFKPMTLFTSRYSSMPKRPHSRPLPDCFMPPNGALLSAGA